MQLYYVVEGVGPIPAGTVERFAMHRAAPLVQRGLLQSFDEKNQRHLNARKKQEQAAEERRASAEALLTEERNDPRAAEARIRAQRKDIRAKQLEAARAERKEAMRLEAEKATEAKRLRAQEQDRADERARAARMRVEALR